MAYKDEKKEAVKKESPKMESNKPKEFGQKEAEKLAASYVPKSEEKRYETVFKDGKDVQIDKFDVMYVTEDKNVFFKQNEGEARSHARDRKIKLYRIEL